jgi:hypothetical protein
MREVRAALRSVYFGKEAPEPTDDATDAQIIAGWLRSESDRQNCLDLSETSGIQDAARRVKAYLTDPELFTGKVYHR